MVGQVSPGTWQSLVRCVVVASGVQEIGPSIFFGSLVQQRIQFMRQSSEALVLFYTYSTCSWTSDPDFLVLDFRFCGLAWFASGYKVMRHFTELLFSFSFIFCVKMDSVSGAAVLT